MSMAAGFPNCRFISPVSWKFVRTLEKYGTNQIMTRIGTVLTLGTMMASWNFTSLFGRPGRHTPLALTNFLFQILMASNREELSFKTLLKLDLDISKPTPNYLPLCLYMANLQTDNTYDVTWEMSPLSTSHAVACTVKDPLISQLRHNPITRCHLELCQSTSLQISIPI